MQEAIAPSEVGNVDGVRVSLGRYASGRWYATAYVPHARGEGASRRPRHALGEFATADQAASAAMAWAESQRAAWGIAGSSRTADMLAAYIDHLGGVAGREPATVSTYRSLLRCHIAPAIGAIEVADVRPHMVQRMYQKMASSGALAPSSIKLVHELLSGAWKWFRELGAVDLDIMRDVATPRSRKAVTGYFPAHEVRAIREAIAPILADDSAGRNVNARSFAMAVLIALGTGLREGEICGLMRRDVRDGRLSVQRKLTESAGRPEYGIPKDSSVRNLTLPPELDEALQAHFAWQDSWMRRTGPSTPIMCSRCGQPIRPSAVSRWFTQLVRSLGISHGTFHTLRHTHATGLVAGKGNLAEVARRLGHASVNTTIGNYVHASPRDDVELAMLSGEVAKGGE